MEGRALVFWSSPTEGPFRYFWKKKDGKDEWLSGETSSAVAELTNLTDGIDYAFYVENDTDRSAVGYLKSGFVPGTVVNYLHPEDKKYAFSGQYLCSPCLLKHPKGYLLASMDVFKGGAPQNLTLIFRSDDNGESWYHYSELFPCFWGSLFLHKGEVYMLGMSTEYGDILIGRSSDGGKTFSKPTALFRGACHREIPGWHRAPMPIIEAKGRLWTGIDYGSHVSGGHATCLLSADAEGDLLDPNTWLMTDPLVYSPNWEGAVQGDNRGFLEGNAVVLPDGEIGNFLRYSTNKGVPAYGLAPILLANAENPEEKLTFKQFVSFPANLSKFEVRWDEESRAYYSLASRINNPETPGMRNLLSLLRSKDLIHWELFADVLDYTHMDPKLVGFQYVSFQFDGEDLIFLSRTAFNGAQSFHDNNYVTFHRIQNFRAIQ